MKCIGTMYQEIDAAQVPQNLSWAEGPAPRVWTGDRFDASIMRAFYADTDRESDGCVGSDYRRIVDTRTGHQAFYRRAR